MKPFCFRDYLQALMAADRSERQELMNLAAEDEKITGTEFRLLAEEAYPV